SIPHGNSVAKREIALAQCDPCRTRVPRYGDQIEVTVAIEIGSHRGPRVIPESSLILFEGESTTPVTSVCPDETSSVDQHQVLKSVTIEIAESEGEIGAIRKSAEGKERTIARVEQDRHVSVCIG